MAYIILAHSEDCQLVAGPATLPPLLLSGQHTGRICTCEPQPVDIRKAVREHLKVSSRRKLESFERPPKTHEEMVELLERYGIPVSTQRQSALADAWKELGRLRQKAATLEYFKRHTESVAWHPKYGLVMGGESSLPETMKLVDSHREFLGPVTPEHWADLPDDLTGTTYRRGDYEPVSLESVTDQVLKDFNRRARQGFDVTFR